MNTKPDVRLVRGFSTGLIAAFAIAASSFASGCGAPLVDGPDDPLSDPVVAGVYRVSRGGKHGIHARNGLTGFTDDIATAEEVRAFLRSHGVRPRNED